MSDQPRAPGDLRVGSHVASYRLDELIGQGGMAVVYRAFDIRLQRRIALKILTPSLARDQEFRQRFIRESRAAAAVDHPNIIPIFEAGEASGFLFIAMRFVEGRDVHAIIEREGALSAARTCSIVAQAASALDAAHLDGLVHRDVKPANMLRDPAEGSGRADHVYLSDFGLSKRSFASTGLTSQGHFLGTLNYIAPEQIEGKLVDGRADQYALACSAFEMLTGVPPFKRDETLAIMWAKLSTQPPAATSVRAELPPTVDPVFAKALAKEADERYRTCLEFAHALRLACGLELGAAELGAAVPPQQASIRQPTQPVSKADLAAAAAAAASPPAPPRAGDPSPAAGVTTADRPAKPPGARGHQSPSSPAPETTATSAATPPQPEAGAPPAPAATQQVETPAPAAETPQPATASQPERAPDTPAARPPQPGPPQQPARKRRARHAGIAIVVTGVVVAAAAATLLSLPGPGKPSAAALVPPACTTAVAPAKSLTSVPTKLVAVGKQPFDMVTTGGFGFVSLSSALAVVDVSSPVPRYIRTVTDHFATGEALTSDHKYLLVAGGGGVTVFRVSSLERHGSKPLGSLSTPGKEQRATQVALSPNGTYAFVTLEHTGEVAVFNLQQALTKGFGASDLVRSFRVGRKATGITPSANGNYLYVTTGLAYPAVASGSGSLVVLDMRKLETPSDPPVLRVLKAGCGPARILVTPDGKTVWVTVAGGNSLVAYSAAKLLTNPSHALIARVAVGQTPLGLILVHQGTQMVVADSNRDNTPGAVSNLAVLDVAKALAGKPALLGTVPSPTPRLFTLEPDGNTLLVTNTASGQVQTVDLTHLP